MEDLWTPAAESTLRDEFLGFTVPAAVLETNGGPNILSLLVVDQLAEGHTQFVADHQGWHLLHMDLQLPARTSNVGSFD